MTPHILLTFGTTQGMSRTLRINNINTAVSDTAVRNAMENIISSNAVHSQTSGRASYMRRASMLETHVTPIDLGIEQNALRASLFSSATSR